MTNDTTETDVSEATLLSDEADQAKKAVLHIVNQLKRDIQHGISPREMTVKHPIVALGVVAAAGFVAGSALMPAKDEAAKDKFAKWQASFLNRFMPHGVAEKSNGRHEKAAPAASPGAGGSVLTLLAREAFHLLRPALLSAIGAAVTAKVGPPPTQPDDSEPDYPQPT